MKESIGTFSRKLFAIVLALAMALALSLLITAPAAAVDLEGDGTAENPLQIGTAAQLFEFGKRVTDGGAGLYAELTADITVDEWTVTNSEGTKYSSIGQWGATFTNDSPSPYVGVFDGKGHSLKLSKSLPTVISEVRTERNRIALFHTVGTAGVVRNLNLGVVFSGGAYIAGVAGSNYGTIENVTVRGTITANTNNSYAGGIAGFSGCKFVEGTLVPGRISDCLNRADVTGMQYVGGITGSFLGEMYRCGNTGTVTGTRYFGGLLAMGANVNPTRPEPVERRFMVSDCYNAGQVVCVSPSRNMDFAGLLGVHSYSTFMADWRDDDGEYVDFQVSNVFSYGSISNTNFPDNPTVIIAGLTTADTAIDFNSTDITNIFSNTYYREGIGDRLLRSDNLIGSDGLGTTLVKSVIKSKTADEFAAADMAVALNAGREGDDAPWEYVEGRGYPTLKFEPEDDGPEPPPAYALAVTAGENGSVSVSSDDDSYVEGDEVTVEAAADDGYRFVEWAAEGITLEADEATANPLIFTMPANEVTLTANFAADEPAPPSDGATVTAGSASGYKGSTVTVPVSITDNPGFYGFSFALSYDKSALELTGIAAGEVIDGKGTLTLNPDEGIATFTANRLDADIAGDGVLLNLTFTIKDAASFTDYPVAVALTDGAAENFVNADGTNPPVAPTPGAVTVLDHTATGDVDGDGDVTSSDVLFAVRTVTKLETPTAQQSAAMDMDADGYVTVTDVLFIAKAAASA